MKDIKLREIGTIATPKQFPALKGEITDIKTFADEVVYAISGGLYTESELEPLEG